jgi:3-oxoacyl-[acyl-carrier protein] reductase
LHLGHRHDGSEKLDLGIKGRRALVCASSKGLGRACAAALAAEGVHVTMTARGAEVLAKAAAELRQAYPTVEITEVAGDITTPEGRTAALAACPNPDILINNAGGPPPGDFRNWTRDDWIKALDANMLTPIELIKATVDGMITRKFGRIVNITSAAVKAPIDVLGLSNGARTGLTGFVAGLSRKTVRHNVTINALLPGPFDTDRLRGVSAGQAKAAGVPVEQLMQARMNENPAGRFGDPEEFGLACAFLCGAKSGYITGQNILLDGGAFPGTL